MVDEPYTEENEYQFNETEDAVYDAGADAGAEQKVATEKPKRNIPLKKVGIIMALFVICGIVTYWWIGGGIKSSSVPPVRVPQNKQIATTGSSFSSSSLATTIASSQNNIDASIQKQPYFSMQGVPVESMKPKESEKFPLVDTLEKPSKSKESQEKITAMVEKNLQATNDFSQEFRHQLMENQSRLEALEQKIGGLENNLGTLQQAVQGLSDSIKKNESLQKELNFYKSRYDEVKTKKLQQKKQYIVQAIVPGRAWLRGADGSFETVTIGEEVKGYGKVISIDPVSGIVATSSGIKFIYGISSN